MLGLRTVCYTVDNMEEARRWYEQAFGTAPYFVESFYTGFDIGGYELGLMPRESTDNGNNTITYWGVDHIQETFQHLLASGARVHEEPHSVGGPLMVASVLDPWNNVVGLIYNPTFKS